MHDYNDFVGAGAVNDDASAIKVTGGKGCCAVVYQHGDFSGYSAEYRDGEHSYNDFVAAGAGNDDVSAIAVFSDGCPSDFEMPPPVVP
jgi:hypothetical protein